MIMHPLLEAQRQQVAAHCRTRGVRRLEVFGSAARNDFNPDRSDFDFLVEFEDDCQRPVLETYFGLKEDLEQLLGRPVDLVSNESIRNPYIRRSIDKDRQLIYAA
jgi:predicted nucleotidyltransferase